MSQFEPKILNADEPSTPVSPSKDTQSTEDNTKDDNPANDAQQPPAEAGMSEETNEEEEGRKDTEECISDLPGTTYTRVDQMMDEIYGDHVHQNDGTHLDGGITDDATWQSYWRQLVVFPSHAYDVPNKSTGRRFVDMVANLLRGIKRRKWNSERLIVFIMVVLQRERGVTSTGAIRKRIETRMEAWKAGKFEMLVQTAVRTNESMLSDRRRDHTDEQRAEIFNQKMLRGDIRGAVRFITEREKGGILMPDDIDEKTGDSVENVLRSKHPEARIPKATDLPSFTNLPDLVELDITTDHVSTVASRLSGSAGLGGVDSITLQQWLLKFGKASAELRKAVAEMTDWLANHSPPWAAYRALMAGRLVALDKCPGVRPVGIGETWRRLFAKIVLLVAHNEAKEVCGIDQLCAGLESGIEGGIHDMNFLWAGMEQEEHYGFLLVDARNAFNEQNRTIMLWVVRHLWPSGARFTFNCYCHHAILMIRTMDGSECVIHSCEGETQGDPIATVSYGLGMMPLTRDVKRIVSSVKQAWYADDSSGAGHFQDIKTFYKVLEIEGEKYGYFPEPTKSILVTSQANVDRAKLEFSDLGFKIKTGHRYLGGFVGSDMARSEWLENRIQDWCFGVRELAKVAVKSPQTAHQGLLKSLQQEWQFVQRVCKDVGAFFEPIERAIKEDFLPALFGTTTDEVSSLRELQCLPIKSAGMALPNPQISADANYKNSILMNSHLLASLRGTDTFRSADHMSVTKEVRSELKLRRSEENESELERLTATMTPAQRRTIMRGKETGQWLSALPTTVSGTILSPQEFRDSLFLRYGLTPPDLPEVCDGCGQKFSINHGLQCKTGGLVILRHDEIKGELEHLAAQALTNSHVRDEPLINPSRAGTVEQANKPCVEKITHNHNEEDRGDLLIRSFWDPATDLIVDVRITDTDAKSYKSRAPAKVLESQEREKKKKYLEPCLQRRRHFTPFVVSADGLKGKEATAFLKRLSTLLAKKWQKPYSVVCGYVNVRISIAIVRATHLCLRGSRVPASQISRRPQWEDKAGLGLARW